MKEAFNVFMKNDGIIILFDVWNNCISWAGIILATVKEKDKSD